MPKLRSKGALLFQPFTIGFTVEPKGEISEAPRRFLAGKNEIVTWIIGNASGEPITVTLDRFLRRDDDDDEVGNPKDEVYPFRWIGLVPPKQFPYPPPTLQLAVGQTGIIAGRVDSKYKFKGFGKDDLSYTIRVAGSFGTVEHDPDGDIKP